MRVFHYGLILLSVLSVTSCSNPKNKEEVQVTYPTMKIELSEKRLSRNYSATITGRQTVEIRPQIEGQLIDIRLKEGASVRKGQVLFEIDTAQFHAAYDIALANVLSAEAAVSTAELVLESNKELSEEDVISEFELNTAKNELTEAKARLQLSQAELKKAATNLSYTLVTSPVNGVASMIPYREGALVSPNIAEPLVTVSDDEEVFAYFSMAENEMLDIISDFGSVQNAIEQMSDVELKMSNGNMYELKGRIDAISGTINKSTGAVSVRAIFQNPNHILKDGGTGTLIIPTLIKNCIVIPQSATYELQDKVFVYKVIDGKTQSVEIKILPQNDGKEYVVTEGLTAGDIIISEGAGLVKEGVKIEN